MKTNPGVIAALLLATTLATAQHIDPKASATAYPTHAKFGDFAIGAEFLVHTIPGELGGLFAGDFLTIETAFFGPKESRAEIAAGHFRLRINGSKITLAPQPASSVAASIKYSDWENPHTLTVDGAYNDKRVIYTPRQEPRFPGDNRGGSTVEPPPGQTQTPERSTGPKLTIDEKVDKAALLEGNLELPRAGLLYFLYKGKTKSIKSLELLYDGPLGKATLKLI
jgi:hypothetical protein